VRCVIRVDPHSSAVSKWLGSGKVAAVWGLGGLKSFRWSLFAVKELQGAESQSGD